MSFLRPFNAMDIFSFNNVNLDSWTETYSVSYYLNNLSTWPDMFLVEQSASGPLMGYVMGKAEGYDKDWQHVSPSSRIGNAEPNLPHSGHVTAITVAPQYRRLGLARSMMVLLEKMSDQRKAWFVDLYVRVTNDRAVKMYESMGYSVYRTVLEYYGGGVRDASEDAYDMRKPCEIDTEGLSIKGGGRHVKVTPEQCWA